MSEYQFVEKPLLNQLATMGWQVIEHSSSVIPKDPSISYRDNFREFVIKREFIKAISTLNIWLTDAQLEGLYEDFIRSSKAPRR